MPDDIPQSPELTQAIANRDALKSNVASREATKYPPSGDPFFRPDVVLSDVRRRLADAEARVLELTPK